MKFAGSSEEDEEDEEDDEDDDEDDEDDADDNATRSRSVVMMHFHFACYYCTLPTTTKTASQLFARKVVT